MVTLKQRIIVLGGVVVLSLVSTVTTQSTQLNDQIGQETSVGGDLSAAATHGHGGHGGGKFFMYAHQPAKKEYEFGFKRGNDYHNVERYEKGGPHHNFKTKVRWHDAKGGHGEHYWDYNHAPKYHDDHGDDHGHGGYGDDHGHGSYDDHGHGHGGDDYHDDHGGYHSQPVPDYAPAATTAAGTALLRTAPQHREALHERPFRGRKGRPQSEPQESSENDSEEDKNYHYTEKKTFEYKLSSGDSDPEQKTSETPSVFPQFLGFNPYQPPEPFFAEDSGSRPSNIFPPKPASIFPPKPASPTRTLPSQPKFSASNPQYSTSDPLFPTFSPQISSPNPQFFSPTSNPEFSSSKPNFPTSNPSSSTSNPRPSTLQPKYPTSKPQNQKVSTKFGRRTGTGVASAPKTKNSKTNSNKNPKTKEANQTASAATPTGLSFDPKTGHIYNEDTGTWYSLVEVKED